MASFASCNAPDSIKSQRDKLFAKKEQLIDEIANELPGVLTECAKYGLDLPSSAQEAFAKGSMRKCVAVILSGMCGVLESKEFKKGARAITEELIDDLVANEIVDEESIAKITELANVVQCFLDGRVNADLLGEIPDKQIRILSPLLDKVSELCGVAKGIRSLG